MASKLSQRSVLTTTSGMRMPVFGCGTFQSSPYIENLFKQLNPNATSTVSSADEKALEKEFEEQIARAINAALEAGYRHFDTAHIYWNEKAIGKALKKWFDSGKIKREELFITTKLPSFALNEKYVEEYMKKSLEALQLTYVDLFLIHHAVGVVQGEGPMPMDANGNIKIDPTTDHLAIWKAMEAQVDAGRTKSIGVSNFNTRQIDRILKVARIPPANNQVELHLYLQQKEMQAWSKKTGVTLTAYAPLGSPNLLEDVKKYAPSAADEMKELNPLKEPAVIRIAESHKKSPAQVLLRHLLQLGLAIVPKSGNPERIRQNFEVFDFQLSSAEMAELNSLDMGEEGRRFAALGFPGFDSHPEYPFPKK